MSNTGLKMGIVVSRFHEPLTASLQEGAISTLLAAGLLRENMTLLHVPGTFETPLAVQTLALSGKLDAIIVLGCVIRGETIHFDLIGQTTFQSLQEISLNNNIPVTLGVVMAENGEQAFERCNGKLNRGAEAAKAALDLLSTLQHCKTIL